MVFKYYLSKYQIELVVSEKFAKPNVPQVWKIMSLGDGHSHSLGREETEKQSIQIKQDRKSTKSDIKYLMILDPPCSVLSMFDCLTPFIYFHI